MGSIELALQEQNIILPEPVKPVADYKTYSVEGNIVIISGQLPMAEGVIAEEHKGQVGSHVSIEQAQDAARICGLNLLSQVKDACDGDLERVKSCLRLGIFVSSTAEFTEHHLVANGVSRLIVSALGKERGVHARAAVVVAQLPLGACVEVEATFSIHP